MAPPTHLLAACWQPAAAAQLDSAAPPALVGALVLPQPAWPAINAHKDRVVADPSDHLPMRMAPYARMGVDCGSPGDLVNGHCSNHVQSRLPRTKSSQLHDQHVIGCIRGCSIMLSPAAQTLWRGPRFLPRAPLPVRKAAAVWGGGVAQDEAEQVWVHAKWGAM